MAEIKGSHEPMDVSVGTYPTADEARMVEALLDDDGIPCFVYQAPASPMGIYFGLQSVNVYVRRSDAERAKSLLLDVDEIPE